jgi:hypothetical protein
VRAAAGAVTPDPLPDPAEEPEVRFPRLDARRFIARLCSRYRVSVDFGRRLEPLVDKAAKSTPEKQRLLLELVERSFAEEGRRVERERRLGNSADDWLALTTVASLLHAWNPPAWFDRWDDEPPRGV